MSVMVLLRIYHRYMYPSELGTLLIITLCLIGYMACVLPAYIYLYAPLWTQMVIFANIIVTYGLRHVCRKGRKATA